MVSVFVPEVHHTGEEQRPEYLGTLRVKRSALFLDVKSGCVLTETQASTKAFPAIEGQLEVIGDNHLHKTTNHESAADEECGKEDVKRRELRVGEPITASGESESP
jgi:hypothetical protein